MGTMCKDCGQRGGYGLDHRYWCPKFTPATDPRDAEIAALKAEVGSKNATIEATRRHVDRLRRALAAGPAALHYRSCDCCSIVERAQAEAMKEKP